MKTICLNMIVKNEKNVIRQCLESVQRLIDYWVIVDTGSTDGTQKIIQDVLRNIPGELHEVPWVNFEHNRNIALDLSRKKCDYTLFIDADETLVCLQDIDKNKLNHDFYFVLKKGQSVECQTALLINQNPGWKWKDVIHEYLINSNPMTGVLLNNLFVDCSSKHGHRSSDPDKAIKDIEILRKALQEDPKNSRYVFYLAQSYANAKQFSLSLEQYEKRAADEKAGNKEEVFWSLHCAATLKKHLQMGSQTIIDSYCRAYQFNSHRSEPLYYLASYLQSIQLPLLAYLVIKEGLSIPPPSNPMKLQKWIYDYGIQKKYDELSIELQKFKSI